MTTEEKLRQAAIQLRTSHGKIQLSSGAYVDDLMVEAADELRRTYQNFGRILLEKENVRVEFSLDKPDDRVFITGTPTPLELREMTTQRGPIELDFYDRHLRYIDIAGEYICTGGKTRCEDCRCNLPDDWRKRDALSLSRTKLTG